MAAPADSAQSRGWIVGFDGWGSHEELCSLVASALSPLPSGSWRLVQRPPHWPALPTDFVAVEVPASPDAAAIEEHLQTLLLRRAGPLSMARTRVRGVWPRRWYATPSPPPSPPMPAASVAGEQQVPPVWAGPDAQAALHPGFESVPQRRLRSVTTRRTVARPPGRSPLTGRVALRAEGRQRDVTGHGKAMPYDFITKAMNASAFWATGARGAGIRVAIFDTGISRTQDFLRHLVEAVDFTPEGITSDTVGHSSFMAGTIASTKAPPAQADSPGCGGLAPDAEIYVARVFNSAQAGTAPFFVFGGQASPPCEA
jgi:membrane-bound transcription factor site-1 protease